MREKETITFMEFICIISCMINERKKRSYSIFPITPQSYYFFQKFIRLIPFSFKDL